MIFFLGERSRQRMRLCRIGYVSEYACRAQNTNPDSLPRGRGWRDAIVPGPRATGQLQFAIGGGDHESNRRVEARDIMHACRDVAQASPRRRERVEQLPQDGETAQQKKSLLCSGWMYGASEEHGHE